MTKNASALRERLSKICLSLPEAEGSSRTGQHAKFTVRGRTFAYFLNDHQGDGRIAVNCKVAPGGTDVLTGGDPERFYVPAYLGPKGWIGMRLDLPGTDWSFAEELVRESYRMVAPKGLVGKLDAAPAEQGAMTLTIDLVPHMDAGDRDAWKDDQNVRPLADLGRRQAEAIAGSLTGEPIDALYASPALRCRQTLEPLAERLSLSISTLPEFGEETWERPDAWPDGPGGAYVSSHAAGRAIAGIQRMRAERGAGRAVVCSHGHIIPNLIAFMIGEHGLADVPPLERRGQWYQVRFEEHGPSVELRQADSSDSAFPA